jgi:hypothetical protein
MEELSNRVKVDFLEIKINLSQILVFLLKINLNQDLINLLKPLVEIYLLNSSNLNKQLEVEQDYLEIRIKTNKMVFLANQKIV